MRSWPTSRMPSPRRRRRARGRRFVRSFGASGEGARLVRVNGFDTPYFEEDVAILDGPRARRCRSADGDARGACCARRCRPSDRRGRRDRDGPAARLRARREPRRLRAAPRGCRPRSGARARDALGRPRAPVRTLEARRRFDWRGGIRPPFDCVHLDIRDDEGLDVPGVARAQSSASSARPASIRTRSRSSTDVVHPRAPTSSRGRGSHRGGGGRAGEGRGAVVLEGELVDAPVVARARRIIGESERGKRDGE